MLSLVLQYRLQNRRKQENERFVRSQTTRGTSGMVNKNRCFRVVCDLSSEGDSQGAHGNGIPDTLLKKELLIYRYEKKVGCR